MSTATAPFPSIGDLVHLLRCQHKLSTRALAKLLRVTHPTIVRIESGQTKLSAERVAELADIFGVAPGFFYPRHTAESDHLLHTTA